MPSTTLVTGATGLVGSHVARLLCERGDAVRVTVRPDSRTDNLEALEVERVTCDVLDRRAVRRAMRGIERVFHVAGSTSLRSSPGRLEEINVEGTRIVCEEALRAGVQRLVHTSSVAALGPARRGSTADETQTLTPDAGDGIPYAQTKAAGEAAALECAERGLPVVIVNPAHVLGSGDVYRSSTELVRRFLRREIPAYVDGALCVVDAEDVARGQLLADERGRVGERYVLGNRNFTVDRLFADLGRLSGVQPPAVRLPLVVAMQIAKLAERMPGRPSVTVAEVRAASQWWAFRSTKAKRELGYAPSHHEDSLQTTIDWYRQREGHDLAAPGARQPLPLRATGFWVDQMNGALGRLPF